MVKVGVMVRSLRVKRRDVCGMGLLCSVVSGTVDVDGYARYTTYGIKIADSVGNMRLFIADVSTNRAFVENFAAICERDRVSLCHVMDVLEDLLP